MHEKGDEKEIKGISPAELSMSKNSALKKWEAQGFFLCNPADLEEALKNYQSLQIVKRAIPFMWDFVRNSIDIQKQQPTNRAEITNLWQSARTLEAVNLMVDTLQGYLEGCDLFWMPSAPTTTTSFSNMNSAYILIQAMPGSPPSALYFVDRSSVKPAITKISFTTGNSISTFIAALYPDVTNNVYKNIFNLSRKQLQDIASLTGHTLNKEARLLTELTIFAYRQLAFQGIMDILSHGLNAIVSAGERYINVLKGERYGVVKLSCTLWKITVTDDNGRKTYLQGKINAVYLLTRSGFRLEEISFPPFLKAMFLANDGTFKVEPQHKDDSLNIFIDCNTEQAIFKVLKKELFTLFTQHLINTGIGNTKGHKEKAGQALESLEKVTDIGGIIRTLNDGHVAVVKGQKASSSSSMELVSPTKDPNDSTYAKVYKRALQLTSVAEILAAPLAGKGEEKLVNPSSPILNNNSSSSTLQKTGSLDSSHHSESGESKGLPGASSISTSPDSSVSQGQRTPMTGGYSSDSENEEGGELELLSSPQSISPSISPLPSPLDSKQKTESTTFLKRRKEKAINLTHHSLPPRKIKNTVMKEFFSLSEQGKQVLEPKTLDDFWQDFFRNGEVGGQTCRQFLSSKGMTIESDSPDEKFISDFIDLVALELAVDTATLYSACLCLNQSCFAPPLKALETAIKREEGVENYISFTANRLVLLKWPDGTVGAQCVLFNPMLNRAANRQLFHYTIPVESKVVLNYSLNETTLKLQFREMIVPEKSLRTWLFCADGEFQANKHRSNEHRFREEWSPQNCSTQEEVLDGLKNALLRLYAEWSNKAVVGSKNTRLAENIYQGLTQSSVFSLQHMLQLLNTHAPVSKKRNSKKYPYEIAHERALDAIESAGKRIHNLREKELENKVKETPKTPQSVETSSSSSTTRILDEIAGGVDLSSTPKGSKETDELFRTPERKSTKKQTKDGSSRFLNVFPNPRNLFPTPPRSLTPLLDEVTQEVVPDNDSGQEETPQPL